MSRFLLVLAAAMAAAAALATAPGLAQDNGARVYGIPITTNIWAGIYTDAQAAQGQKFYAAACTECHGKQLEGDPGQGFPAVAGPGFMVEWEGQTMADLVRHIHTGLNNNPGDMDPDTAVVLAAFLLNQNGVPPGKTPLSTDAKEQAKILFTQFKPR